MLHVFSVGVLQQIEQINFFGCYFRLTECHTHNTLLKVGIKTFNWRFGLRLFGCSNRLLVHEQYFHTGTTLIGHFFDIKSNRRHHIHSDLIIFYKTKKWQIFKIIINFFDNYALFVTWINYSSQTQMWTNVNRNVPCCRLLIEIFIQFHLICSELQSKSARLLT